MELKELVGEELFTQISSKLNGHSVIIAGKDEKYIKDDGSFIPKTRFNEVIEQKNNYKESFESTKTELDTLKTKLEGNEAALKQVDDLKLKLDGKDKEMANITKRYALEIALRDSGSRYPDLLQSKFSLEKIELDESGKIKDWENQLKTVKESYPDLFGSKANPKGDGGPSGDTDAIVLTDAQKLEAYEKFPAVTKDEAEKLWFGVLKKTGKIK